MEGDNNEQDKKLIVMAESLVASETRVEALERVTAAQEAELAVLNTRLAASEAEVMNLRKETAAQSADLMSVPERVAATETDVQHLKEDTAAHRTDLTTMKTDVMNLIKSNDATATEVEELKMDSAAHEAELAAVKTTLAATATEVDNLTMNTTPKVAFSAGLTNSGHIQAGDTDLNLVFSRIITNVGKAYSKESGFFTAPVNGVYYFRFTVLDVLSSRSMSIRMFKNGQGIMWLNGYNADGQNAYLSSGLTLQLEVGDVVNLGIRPGHRLYDSSNSHSTFSGFLLFPL
ncbi:uncharacterized protein LOC134461759 [Engraulis encrasicolus]|uniref:uncharacterized protein LOC134461759 n=1 Tax=Engraulis encrasicolus TaxID=184585 RepID=UPI002FCF4F93